MKWTKLCGYFAFLATFSTACFAEEAEKKPQFSDGKGYFMYKQPREEQALADGKLRLLSFFYYDCAACVTADDYLRLYAERNPDKVVLERYPYFNEGKTFTARLHAAFVEFGRADLSDLYLFDSEGRKGDASLVANEAAVEKWLVNHGVDIQAFKQLYASDKVRKRVDEYVEVSRKYVPSTAPFVSINGKYVLTQHTLYNDDYTYAVLDFLYEKERAAQQEKK